MISKWNGLLVYGLKSRYLQLMGKSFSKSLLDCISSTQITHVRVGADRTKFTGIWMVVAQGRIFARSYYLRERSWYNTFLAVESGEIKCGDTIVAVNGIKPKDLKVVTPLVNTEYQKKYGTRPSNQKWIDGLCEPQRVQKTMEFVPI